MQQFPASDTPQVLPYIIIVQTCGKRWDLPKFVDVLSVNLGFSQSLIWMIATRGESVMLSSGKLT